MSPEAREVMWWSPVSKRYVDLGEHWGRGDTGGSDSGTYVGLSRVRGSPRDEEVRSSDEEQKNLCSLEDRFKEAY